VYELNSRGDALKTSVKEVFKTKKIFYFFEFILFIIFAISAITP